MTRHRKRTVADTTLMIALMYSKVPGVTVIQHAQYQDPETVTVKWNSAIIYDVFIYICAFLTMKCQHVFWDQAASKKKKKKSQQKLIIILSFTILIGIYSYSDMKNEREVLLLPHPFNSSV